MLKLLIIDDEKWTRDGLKKCIPWASLGIKEIMEAGDGKSGIEVALSFKPDIILSDIRMPKMTGIEFATYIRKELPNSKIIFISGYSDKEYLKSAIQLKAVSYIEKPINANELINAVKTAVNEYLTEKKQYLSLDDSNKRLHKSIPIIKQELALKLIENKVNTQEISNLISLSGENLPFEGSYLTIIYKLNQIEGCTQEEFDSIKLSLLKIITETFVQENICNITGVKDYIYIVSHVLLNSGHNSQSIRKISDNIRSKLIESIGLTPNKLNILFTGIGLSAKGMENIYTAYQTAFLAVQNVFFLGKRNTAVYENTNSNPFVFTNELEKIFEKYIISNDKDGVNLFIKNTIDEILRHESTLIDNIKDFFYHLLIRIKTIAEQNSISLFNGSGKNDYLWKMVSNALTLQELSNFLLDTVNCYFSCIEEKTGANRTIYRIKNIIQSSYMNKNLSLLYISEQLSLTPAYLCQVFKKETGLTIHDYINEIRINKAKELLKEGNPKILEIAQNCGFNEVKYFTRVFKALTGKTPSHFREEL